jgi:hypothetical protein
MKLAFPLYMCLTFPIFHYGPPWPFGAFLGGPYIISTPETVEPVD